MTLVCGFFCSVLGLQILSTTFSEANSLSLLYIFPIAVLFYQNIFILLLMDIWIVSVFFFFLFANNAAVKILMNLEHVHSYFCWYLCRGGMIGSDFMDMFSFIDTASFPKNLFNLPIMD